MLLVGSLPPPENGMTLSMRALLESALVRRFEVVHLDTSDHRGIENVGQIDLRNIKLALLHGAKFSWFLLRYRPAVVYLPIARTLPPAGATGAAARDRALPLVGLR